MWKFEVKSLIIFFCLHWVLYLQKVLYVCKWQINIINHSDEQNWSCISARPRDHDSLYTSKNKTKTNTKIIIVSFGISFAWLVTIPVNYFKSVFWFTCQNALNVHKNLYEITVLLQFHLYKHKTSASWVTILAPSHAHKITDQRCFTWSIKLCKSVLEFPGEYFVTWVCSKCIFFSRKLNIKFK